MTDKLRDDLLKRADEIDPVLEVEFDTQRCVEQNPYGATEAIEKALYLIRDMRAALAAAPQPAPEREAGRAEGWAEAARFLETLKGADLDGNEFELPADEWRVTALLGVRACADKLGALLARGLRLPSQDDALQQLADLGQQADRAPEPMAWAVVGSDGKMVAINYDRMTAQHLCNPGERIVRVAIRVVEGGDNAA